MARPPPRLAWPAWLLAGGVLLLLVPFVWPLAQSGVYVGNGSDIYSYQYPMRAAIRRMLAAGEWPLWNPWMLAGAPLLGAWQLGLLYPLSWLTLALPPGLGLDVDRALHGVILIGGAMALGNARFAGSLLRPSRAALASAALIAGAGVTWGHIYAGHVSFHAAWAWQPWVLALALRATRTHDRLAWLGAVGCFGLGLLAGHPQVVTYGAYALMAVLLAEALDGAGWTRGGEAMDDSFARRVGTAVVVGATVGIGGAWLAAAQLLPTIEMLPALNRSLATREELAQAFSPPLASLLTAIAPEAFGSASARASSFGWHEAVGGLSPGLLALALTALPTRRGWILGLAVVAFIALVPGENGPLLSHLIGVAPGVDAFRVPSRWWLAATLLVATLVADAVGHTQSADTSAPVTAKDARTGPPTQGTLAGRALYTLRWLLPAALAVGAIALAITLTSATPWWRTGLKDDLNTAESAAIAVATGGRLAWAALVAAAVAVAAARAQLRQVVVIVVLVAAVADAGALAGSVLDKARMWPLARMAWTPAQASALTTAVGNGRRLTTAPRLRHANRGGADGVAIAGGYETAVPMMTNRYLNLANGRPADRYQVNFQLRRASPWLDRMAVSHLLYEQADGATRARFPAFREVARSDGLVLAAAPTALPRLGLAPQRRLEPDRQAAIAALETLAADVVLVDRELKGEARDGTLLIASERNDRVDIDVRLEQSGVVVLRDVWMAGWTARIDDAEVDIAIADGLFRAVAVPAGSHRLRFDYVPPGLLMGIWLAAAGWLAFFAALVLVLRSRKRREA